MSFYSVFIYLCAIMSLFDRLNGAKQEKLQANLEKGKAFLEENAKKTGIVCLPSGLQYAVITEGPEGPKPKATDTVTCHYEGKLLDGRVFDSSVRRGQPASFPLNRVISGWTEALQLMTAGSKWVLFLPPHLAYGEQQAGALIEPNSTLIFEVELLSF
jgi:FKBP-type peptidyl-prolyl cis-trans isomerase FklB